MKNRDRYILKVNEYDLLMNIHKNIEHGTHCPIKAVSGEYTYDRCLSNTYSCSECVQKWLNEDDANGR